jgi:hypothetical protein
MTLQVHNSCWSADESRVFLIFRITMDFEGKYNFKSPGKQDEIWIT